MLHLPRWLWLNHVPAGLELTREQRLDVRRRVRAMKPGKLRGQGLGRVVLIRLLPATFVLSLSFLVWIFWLPHMKLPPGRFAMVNVLGILLFQAMTWIIIAWSVNRAMAPAVWRALNQIGFRVCEQCGYILDYLPLNEPRCPECGTTLQSPTNPATNAPTSAEP